MAEDVPECEGVVHGVAKNSGKGEEVAFPLPLSLLTNGLMISKLFLMEVSQIELKYRLAVPQPSVSLSLFKSRIKAASARDHARGVPENIINDALYLNAAQYRARYSTRKTNVNIYGNIVMLDEYFNGLSDPAVTYRTFWQRVKRLEKDKLLDWSTIEQAGTLSNTHWIAIFGGGRRRRFRYEGEAFPEQFGAEFSSVAAFLLEIGKYEERHSIWARLKSGWDIDEAIIAPIIPLDDRTGLIYLITCTRTSKKYVGLTRMSLEQRWRHHVRVAVENRVQTPLAKEIRRFDESSFRMESLELGINQEELPEREKFWIKKLNTMIPSGLNAVSGGQMGGGRGRAIEYDGESFQSLESAASTLSRRTGLAKHVVLKRLGQGEALPASARRMSNHPEAGSNLWRRWKSLINAIKGGRRNGNICEKWMSYDNFAADVRPGFKQELRLIRKDDSKPWCADNFKWVSKQVAIEAVHGSNYEIDGRIFCSLASIAKAYGLRSSTFKNRIQKQGLPIEEAARKPLNSTSKYTRSVPVVVDGEEFSSENEAAKYAAAKYGITFDQARDRIRRKRPL